MTEDEKKYLNAIEQGWKEYYKKKEEQKEHNLCVCGHYDRYHKDTGVFENWGAGECEICNCKKFICFVCSAIIAPPEKKEMTLRECIEELGKELETLKRIYLYNQKIKSLSFALTILERLETIKIRDGNLASEDWNLGFEEGQQNMLDRLREGK